MKSILILAIGLLIMGTTPLRAQFSESKERKKMWGKSLRRHKKREAFNPYLDKKHKPSEELGKQNKRELRRQNRAAKKQMKRNKKNTGH